MASHSPHDPIRADDAPPLPAERRDAPEPPRSPDEAHRRAAFGRRPGDVPALPERRRPILPWVAGALLLLALLPLLGQLRNGGRGALPAWGSPAATAAAGGEVARGSAVERFADWAGEGGNDPLPPESEANHPYTAQGIRLLADALAERTRSAGPADAAQRVAAIRAEADRLQTRGDVDRHAEYARAAFENVARLVGELGDPARGAAVMARASAVDADRPLSPQGEAVRRFFREAAAALD